VIRPQYQTVVTTRGSGHARALGLASIRLCTPSSALPELHRRDALLDAMYMLAWTPVLLPVCEVVDASLMVMGTTRKQALIENHSHLGKA
jgi:hypothetical protein